MLISNNLHNFKFWQWLEKNIINIVDSDFEGVSLVGVPESVEGALLCDIEEIVSADISRVLYLENDVYSVYCDLSFIGHFDCDVGYEQLETINPNQVLLVNKNDPYWTQARVRAVVAMIIRVDFDISAKEVIDSYSHVLESWSDYNEVIDKLNECKINY